MSIFTGAGVAIITPMTETGAVNYPKLEEILEYQIANGTDAIIICGTTGESSTLVPVLIVQRPLSIFLRKQKNTVWTAFSW